VSASLLSVLASSHPARRHTGTPIRDSLRLIDAQLYTAWRHLRWNRYHRKDRCSAQQTDDWPCLHSFSPCV